MALTDLSEKQIRLEGGLRWAAIAGAVALVGWIATLLLVASSEQGLARFLRAYLVNFSFFLSLALGALFFVLVTHLTRAGWSVALRRIAEAISLTLLPLAGFALLLFLGRHELYEWTHSEAVAADALLQHKRAYLNTNFFLVRLVFYFAVWNGLALYFARRSVAQDRTGDAETTIQMERVAAPGMIFFAMTLTFAAFDLLMSLYPHWYSTIFGVYYFAGSAVGLFSLVTLLVFTLQGAGRLAQVITVEHYHDLGKLIFAFVVFWTYIAFSQYMLIWYANVPEETEWFLVRQSGPWLVLSLVLLGGHFLVPFLWLISRHPKRRRGVLAAGAGWMLLMHWFDLYYLVMPEFIPDRWPFDLLDLSCLLGIGGVFLGVVFWRLGQAPLVPVRDPRLAESLRFENA